MLAWVENTAGSMPGDTSDAVPTGKELCDGKTSVEATLLFPGFTQLLFMDLVLLVVVPANPTRRRIVEVLSEGEHSVGELARIVKIKRPEMSRHLTKLCRTGFLNHRYEHRRHMYSLRRKRFRELQDWLDEYRRNLDASLDLIGSVLTVSKVTAPGHLKSPGSVPPPSPAAVVYDSPGPLGGGGHASDHGIREPAID